jgi:hypothetical protein
MGFSTFTFQYPSLIPLQINTSISPEAASEGHKESSMKQAALVICVHFTGAFAW